MDNKLFVLAVRMVGDIPADEGRIGKGIALASANKARLTVNGAIVQGSGEDFYTVTETWCNCLDANAPSIDGIKWCKHQIARRIIKEYQALEAPVAAVILSERQAKEFRSYHIQVTDQGCNKVFDVYLKKYKTSFEARCECGRAECKEARITGTCKHIKAAIKLLAGQKGMNVSFTDNSETAQKLRNLGKVFSVISVPSKRIALWGMVR